MNDRNSSKSLRLSAGALLALFFLLSSSCGRGGAGGKSAVECTGAIAPTEAIAIAEEFIWSNGYTLREPDRSRFVRQYPESGSVDEILNRRRGVLDDRAFGYSKQGEDWLLLFSFSTERKTQGRRTGRAVSVDRCGGSVTLEHQEVYLDTAAVVISQ